MARLYGHGTRLFCTGMNFKKLDVMYSHGNITFVLLRVRIRVTSESPQGVKTFGVRNLFEIVCCYPTSAALLLSTRFI
jgi:hypothetical protein